MKNRAYIFILITTALLFAEGCSIIGYGAGTLIDHSKSGQFRIPNDRADFMERSNEVTITRNDSTIVRGFLLAASVKTDTVFETSEETDSLKPVRIYRDLESISINAYGERVVIPGEQVASIYTRDESNFAAIGLFSGLAFDLISITWFFIAISSMGPVGY